MAVLIVCKESVAFVLLCGICTHVVNVMSCDVGLVYHCPILPCRLLRQLPCASAINIIKHVDCAANQLVDQGLAKKCGGHLFEKAALVHKIRKRYLYLRSKLGNNPAQGNFIWLTT